MERPLVVPREQGEGLRLEDRYFVVVTGEGADVVERVEPGESDEGNLVALLTPKNLRAPEAGDAPHRWEQIGQQEAFVRVGVLGCGPATPQARDHIGKF